MKPNKKIDKKINMPKLLNDSDMESIKGGDIVLCQSMEYNCSQVFTIHPCVSIHLLSCSTTFTITPLEHDQL